MTDAPEGMIDRAAATELVLERRAAVLEALPTSKVDIDAIAGRTLAEAIVADRDVPDRDIATMDGFAVDATDDYPLTVLDTEVSAEATPPDLPPGHAVGIATGARLPSSANAVLRREDATIDGDRLTGPDLAVGTYTYERGSNVSAGEVLFDRNERLAPRDAIFLRDLGHERVEVRDRLSVGVLATGSEIHDGTWDDLDTPMLVGLVRSWGHEATALGTVPDDLDAVVEAIETAAAAHDVVVTTGGTSVGTHDYVIDALRELGEVRFHRVRVRPGKPMAMGVLAGGAATAFAIPGKPIGAHTVSVLVMRPFFAGHAECPTVEATFAVDLDLGEPGFEYVVPVTLDAGTATPLGHTDSALSIYGGTYDPSVLSSSTRATRADGFVIATEPIERGAPVGVVPYHAVE